MGLEFLNDKRSFLKSQGRIRSISERWNGSAASKRPDRNPA
ncbi:conserved hypothetical protein [Burkholderia mallei PRL-20]|uniref:Uncharacterized protein n=2 Tax=pseudomallei group TaxID=111527 RepID=A2RYW9_BURM9|nr:hypothetical protein BMASAVP1_0794 [Burkholderia mallei SAVP1]ABM98999.2 hypothetical protein BMA10229_1085 [Burkholderia mallei NCTC 10229]ABN87472.1 hypothetical protein BURPS668_A0623 [Burkholderia pseudomallei 668]EBA45826.1 hypothetical protein BURPS305_7921 [Burkholderia pseudomallei 305]EDK52651.1 hypothetical protein BMAFMH_G0065 [Burkholderia mallei FMH]EDK61862.1 hypothetical protein BMAJHU_I1017 [Burkholderia mallei JHU]EDK83176.1 hypothetical protein BMA721280_M0225 [Burkholder